MPHAASLFGYDVYIRMALLWLFASTFLGLSYGLCYSSIALTKERRATKVIRWSSQDDDGAQISSCPFSQAFPRYRIDLTRSSSKKKETPPFFLQWMSWIPNQQETTLTRKYPSSRIVWLKGQDGTQAMASLWEEAALIAASFPDNDQSVIVALPDCDDGILLNWKELMDWILENQSGNFPAQLNMSTVLETTLLEEEHAVMICRRMNRKEIKSDKHSTMASYQCEDDKIVTQRQRAWVKRLLVNLSICPFTKSVSKSGQGLSDLGVPVGRIAYHVSRSTTIYQLLADTWRAIQEMMEAGPSGKDGVSSILLAAPAFDEDFQLWSGPIFSLLEQTVVAAQAQSAVGVVCFHPLYATPDGSSWPGFGHMHSVPRLQQWIKGELEKINYQGAEPSYSDVAAGGAWQRRMPHATINVLRADQLALAESQRNTPKLYTRNIQVLLGIGNEKLFSELEREQNMGDQDNSKC